MPGCECFVAKMFYHEQWDDDYPRFFSSLQVPLFALFLKGGGSTLKKNAFAGGGEAQLERLAP